MTPDRWAHVRLAVLLLGAIGALVGCGGAASAAEIGPESDFCAAVRSLSPGEELVLRPGDYRGPCTIRKGGQPGAPIVIRAADPARRPHLVYDGSASNVLNIRASHVTIRGLAFGPTRRAIDGIKIYAASDILVEDCEFHGMGGIAISANHHNVERLMVRRNAIIDSRATAMYFGCHDGAACAVSGLLVERNLIRGVTAPDPEIGYGIQVKLNSSGVVRGNVVLDSKGPGIMVYGATDAGTTSVVERNAVSGSRHAAGIVVAGGPAIVRNNVLALNAAAGIELSDYRRRGLLRRVSVLHNSVYQGDEAGIALSRNGGAQDVTVAFNAVRVLDGPSALPAPRPGLRLIGNVECGREGCFRDAAHWDFSPSDRLSAARGGDTIVGAGDDFFGTPRRGPGAVGAIEGPSAPVRLDPRETP